jgi:hypothetical protein
VSADLAIAEKPTEYHLPEPIGWWLEIRCAYGRTTYYPCWLKASQMSSRTILDDVLPRFRCEGCNGKPATLALIDNPARGTGCRPSPWAIRLHLAQHDSATNR